MDATFQSRIVAAFNALPDGCRYPAATDAEIIDFEATFGAIPDDFRWFLKQCGGGTVGAEWVDGINELRETHEKFNRERGPDGWTLDDVFVIGWDGAGNPFGIHTSGKLIVGDHNFGGVHVMADSFAAFLDAGLLS
ncbi:MAG: SMI1/KNR4 family protein [Planctomycetota bacterium]